MNWPEKFWIVTALWAFESSATFYWRRRAKRIEKTVQESWINYLSSFKRSR